MAYTNQDEVDLFGDFDESQFEGTESVYPPPPTDAPMGVSVAAQIPMPMPAVPFTLPCAVSTGGQARGSSAVSVPDFTREQKRELWNIIKATRRPGSKTTDPQKLLQRFLDNKSASTTRQTTFPASAPSVPNVPISTQLQPKANPPPPGAKINHARNKNTDNRINQYDWYDEFPVRPNWTATNGHGTVQIKYNKQGELKPVIQFDRRSLEAYIRGCANNGIPLRLWVQNSATMHTDRFPSQASAMCRAANCPDTNHTIARGNFQVCFDEHPTETSNGRFDPFFVAGYMHLFCLEEMIPMAELMTFADVQADTREFPLEQRNPMSLNRDGAGRTLLGVYNEWKNMHYDSYVMNNLPIPQDRRRSDDRLYKFLTVKKMEAQPSTRQKMRDQRNGFDISKHCGNLRKLMSYKAEAKKKRKQARNDSSEDGSNLGDSDNEINLAPRAPAPKRRRNNAGNATTTTTSYAVYTAMQSPLRRSRRLSAAQGVQHIEMPAAAPAPVQASILAPDFLLDPSQIYFSPYDASNLTTHAPAPVPSPPRTARAASLGLNVRTDIVPAQALPQVDNGANSTYLTGLDFNFDYSALNLDLNSDNFWNTYNQVSYQDSQVQPLTGLPPLHAYGASPSSPYKLRDTQARRKSAVRLLSARSSQINSATHNVAHSAGAAHTPGNNFIDPQLLSLVGGAAAPTNAASTHSLKHPSWLHSSTSVAPELKRPAASIEEILSPRRPVTRSMTRRPSGSMPVDQVKPKTPVVEAVPQGTTATAPVVDLTADDAAMDDWFANIDYDDVLNFIQSQNNGQQETQGVNADNYFDN